MIYMMMSWLYDDVMQETPLCVCEPLTERVHAALQCITGQVPD